MDKPVPPFIVIPMPVDSDGNGPAFWPNVAKVVWEVWDQLNQTISSHETKKQADKAKEQLDHDHPASIPADRQ